MAASVVAALLATTIRGAHASLALATECLAALSLRALAAQAAALVVAANPFEANRVAGLVDALGSDADLSVATRAALFAATVRPALTAFAFRRADARAVVAPPLAGIGATSARVAAPVVPAFPVPAVRYTLALVVDAVLVGLAGTARLPASVVATRLACACRYAGTGSCVDPIGIRRAAVRAAGVRRGAG